MKKPSLSPMRKQRKTAGNSLAMRLAFWLASFFFFLSSYSLASLSQATPSSPIRALIVTGQNSHSWPQTSQALEQILEDTGLFVVDIAVSPPSGASMKNFRPDFSTYQLVVLDYSGDSWPSSTRKAFVDFVKKGGGVVVYHSANNAFADWPEYSEIIGLAGWGNRDEKAGPYVFWKDGQVVQDRTPGLAGYHTPVHPFLIVNRNFDHPIMAGLPERWMHADDELYGLLRGPAKNLTILATAYSALDRAGTGRHEPVLFTVTYGQGRIFHTVLGHAAGQGPFPAIECVGFIITFQRGAEWAATGRVTQGVPPDYPATERSVSTPEDVRRWPGYRPPSLDSLLEAAADFEHSKDEEVIYRLRDYVRAHKDRVESRRQMEDRFLAFLESNATLAAKMEVCRHLRLIGSEKAIPILRKMLLLPETTDLARYALEKIPGLPVDEALLQALSQTHDEVRIGIISSLGQRRAASAASNLGELLNDEEPETAIAAAVALGQIGGVEATRVLLREFDKGGAQREVLASSLLQCAEKMVRHGMSEQAFLIYDKIYSSDLPIHLRQAALKGKIGAAGEEEARRFILEALESRSIEDDEPAIGLVRDFFDANSIGVVTGHLQKLPEPSQIQLLTQLADYPGPTVLPAILEAARASQLSVRLAALKALAKTGDASLVSFLAECAATSRGQEKEAARACLSSLRGKDVADAIRFGLLATPREEVKLELIQAVEARRMDDQKPLLFELARSGSVAIRRAASRALRHLASRQDIVPLLDLLLETEDETVGEETASSIAAACQKIPELSQRTRPIEERLEPGPNSKESKVQDPAQRSRLYALLGRIGNDRSLPLLRAGLVEEDPAVVNAVVRSLAEWPTPTPRHDLLSVARTSSNLTHRILSIRGYVRMIGLEKYQSPAGAVSALNLILQAIERPEEVKLVLGAAAEFPCPEALQLAQSYLGVKEVEEEARAAVQAIEEKLAAPPKKS